MKTLSLNELTNISGGENAQPIIVVADKYADCQTKEHIAFVGSAIALGTIGAFLGAIIGLERQGPGIIACSILGGALGAYAGLHVGLANGLIVGLQCRATTLAQ
ncbi:MAG: hypothetical protein U1E78_01050 [Gammaproteobacteria bacterium]